MDFCIASHAVKHVGVSQFRRQILWVFLQCCPVLGRGVRIVKFLPERFGAGKVPSVRFAENFSRCVELR